MLQANHPFSLILFGASGHLARIKIFPALYYLALKKRLPKDWFLVGYARTAMTESGFRDSIAMSVREHVPEVNDAVLRELLTHCSYVAGSYDAIDGYRSLSKHLKTLEGSVHGIVRVAYLSIPPSVFSATIHHLCEGGVREAGKDFRCIIEKPVGSNLKDFERIRSQVEECFPPQEVYILDHYLGKEAVRNTYYLRHANPVIERLLTNALISHVQITASETAGLEGRAGYFDAVGTLRDMVQSHLLQIAALLTMRLTADTGALKSVRLDAMRKLYIPPAADLKDTVLQGQYGAGSIGGKPVIAYRDEEGVQRDSRTSTFALLKLMSRSSRWEGVPIFLRSGKRLSEKQTKISIEFHESPTLIGKGESRNRLEIILQGEAGMKLHLQTKLGGSEPKFRPLLMEDPLVCMGDCMVEHSLLLLEAINGNQQWFLDPEEVRQCWMLIDPLQQHLDHAETPLHPYPSGSQGPAAADTFMECHGHRWF
jgi:glucose-6-phosphate 1-dehydrogenase